MQVVEHISEEVIARYGARRLAPAELLAVQAHIGGCAACRLRLDRAMNVDTAIQNLRRELVPADASTNAEPEHLAYEQLAFYVDGKLDTVDREITESHLAICQGCQNDVSDLRGYQLIAEAVPPSMALETTEEVAPTLKAAPKRQPQLFGKLVEWRRQLFASGRFAWTGAMVPAGMVAAAVVAVLAVAIWLAMRPGTQNDNTERAKVETANRAPSPIAPDTQKGNDSSMENRNAPKLEGVGDGVPAASPMLPPSTQPQPGTRPPSNSASPALTLNDRGEEVAVDRQGNLNGLESLPASVRQAVRRSINAQRAQTPSALDAIAEGNAGVLMSGSAEFTNNGVPFALVAPLGKVLRESQPALRWRPLAGAKSYTVAVVDANFNVVAQSPRLTATTWKLDKALPRGANYTWQVTAVQADGSEVVSPVSPAPQAKFRVMDKNALDEVTRLEQAGVRSHLARGVVYAEAGLIDEARAEFEALVQENPRSLLARKLLNSVKR